MHSIVLCGVVDFEGWRRAARALALHDVPPEQVAWSVDEAADASGANGEPLSGSGAFSVPRSLIALAETVIQARDPARFGLLYAMVWRSFRGEKTLLQAASDPLVRRLTRLADAVRLETERMRSQIRFRDAGSIGPPCCVAWFDPAHYILDANAAFFVQQFGTQPWSILTPYRSLHWDGRTLHPAAGAPPSEVPDDDAVLAYWRAHFAAVFPPARPPIPVMASEPREIAAEASACRRCALWEHASRIVLGEGPLDARMMLVGEQPGDQEDLAGRPFVGPAGQLLDRALKAAGIERRTLYVTNAVKHFKFEQRGKRRLHVTPDRVEIEACRVWLDQERSLVKPAVLVLLGASAARAVFGRAVTISRERGRAIEFGEGHAFITIHPSYVLRLPDQASKQREFDALVSDLCTARSFTGLKTF